MIRLRYHEVFFRLSAPTCTGMAAGAICLKNPHDIVTLSFSEFFFQVEGQAKWYLEPEAVNFSREQIKKKVGLNFCDKSRGMYGSICTHSVTFILYFTSSLLLHTLFDTSHPRRLIF